MKTAKIIAISVAIIASLTTITSLVSCEEGNVVEAAALTEEGPVTRAARLSNIYLAKRWSKLHVEPRSEQVAEENEFYLKKAKEHLTAPAPAQRTLVNELLARDWEFGSKHSQRFDDPNKHAKDPVIWAESCMTKLCWGPGYYTKPAEDVIYALVESVLDKELGRTMAAYPAASKLKQNVLLVEDAITPGPSTEKLQKVREVLNFDWEAGKELQRLVPGRTYPRHELIIMLAEIPMPSELRAAAILWVDGL